MDRVISVGAASFKSSAETAPSEVTPDGYAEDDEFRKAYATEKPRWADLAERLK
jgi:hypothetical protein